MCVYFLTKRCLAFFLAGCLISLQDLSHANPSIGRTSSSLHNIPDLNSIESGILEAREEEHQQQQPLSEDVILNAKAQGMLMTLKDLEEEPADASDVHIVNDCVTVSMEEGVFYYKSKGKGDTCGLFFITDPDKSIKITINYLDVECLQGGLISIVDGWELNGQLFPSVADHEKRLEERFHEFCGRRKKVHRSFYSSQNAAVIQYRIPMFGQGFSVRVQHVVNPRPCNILVQDTEAIYTLQNYGRQLNCSLTTIFDAKIQRLYLSVGTNIIGGSSQVNYYFSPLVGMQNTIYHKCDKLGLHDYVQFGGSNGLDTSNMAVVDEFCGFDPNSDNQATTIFCGMTTVRLVSSGKYFNKVMVEVKKAGIEDIEGANYFCDI